MNSQTQLPHEQEKEILLDKNEAAAQYRLGNSYLFGEEDVPIDDDKAFKCFQIAAGLGHSGAQCNLGYMYLAGRGVEVNEEKARELHQLSAEQGHAHGEFNLGVAYWCGKGGVEDKEMALKLILSSAKKSDAEAQRSLGVKYWYGQVVKEDKVEATKWLRLSAEQGHQPAIDDLSNIKNNFSARYHFLMLQKDIDVDAISELFLGKTSLSGELLFDIKRSSKNGLLLTKVISIVPALNDKGVDIEGYAQALMSACIERMLSIYDRDDVYDNNALLDIYEELEYTDFSFVEPEYITPLFWLLIKAWDSIDEINNIEMREKTVIYLNRLIHKLNSENKPDLDEKIIFRCSSIFVTYYLKDKYILSAKSMDLITLNSLLPLVKLNLSAELINQCMGGNIIQPKKIKPEQVFKQELLSYVDKRDKNSTITLFGFSKELKIQAANKVIDALNFPKKEIKFSSEELKALTEGDLGVIMNKFKSILPEQYHSAVKNNNKTTFNFSFG